MKNTETKKKKKPSKTPQEQKDLKVGRKIEEKNIYHLMTSFIDVITITFP